MKQGNIKRMGTSDLCKMHQLSEHFMMNSPNKAKYINEIIDLMALKYYLNGLAGNVYLTNQKLKEIHRDLHYVEFSLQKCFGFPEDINYHRFWEWQKCCCPIFDNMDLWGLDQSIHSNLCPIHGDKIND